MAIIGLSLSNEQLNHEEGDTCARTKWRSILDISVRHTFLNKLPARHNFYTASLLASELILFYTNQIRHLSTTLTSVGVSVPDNEIAMASLNELPPWVDNHISALVALDDEGDRKVGLDFVKSLLRQEEQRFSLRASSSTSSRPLDAALIATGCPALTGHGRSHIPSHRPMCDFCHKVGHVTSRCFKQFSHLRLTKPPNASGMSTSALPPTDHLDHEVTSHIPDDYV